MMTEKNRMKILVTLLAGAMALAVLSCLLPSQADAQTRGGAGQVRPATGSSWSVTPSDYNGTLTGRTRVSESHSLSDIISTYGLDTEVWGTRGDGGVLSLTNEPAVELTAPTDGGTQAIETHQKFRYSAGYPQQILQTAALITAANAGTYRWGYFDDNDGLFWQADSTGLSIVRRTSTSGSPVEFKTAVSTNAVLTNGNVYELRFLWLGYFQVDAYLNGSKVFTENFAGRGTAVYMKTAYLPIRAEVQGIGAKLKYVCTSVQSESASEAPSVGFSAVRPTDKSITTAAGILPIIAIRPALTFRGQVSRIQTVPTSLSCFADGKRIRVYAIWNPTTLTGASWAAYQNTAMEVDVAASAYTGGENVSITGVADNSVSEIQFEHLFGLSQRTMKTHAFGAASDVLLVAADALLGTTLVSCSIEWKEFR
jgi:hypothetical protein